MDEMKKDMEKKNIILIYIIIKSHQLPELILESDLESDSHSES